MKRAISTAARRAYAATSKPARAQPLQVPSLDASSALPAAPRASTSAPPLASVAAASPASASRIPVPTVSASSADTERQLVTVTLRTKALDIEAPSLGIPHASFPYVWLRDACTSTGSVDPSTRQKLFKTEDIPSDIKPWDVTMNEEEHTLHVTWDRPLANSGKARHEQEKSVYDLDFLRAHADYSNWRRYYKMDEIEEYKAWDKASLKRELLTVPHEKLSNPTVVQAGLSSLYRNGLVVFKDVPTEDRSSDSCSLIELARKFGQIQRTWYGENVFHVRSLASSAAKNIAYTSLQLDLHMDLLHFEAPPRWQFLHCLHIDPDLEGGESYFVDAFKAAELLKARDPAAFEMLSREKVGFEYKNDGHFTYAERPTLEFSKDDPDKLYAVNYSPPFQAPFRLYPSPSASKSPHHAASESSASANDNHKSKAELAAAFLDAPAPAGPAEDPTDRIHAIHRALSAFSAILQDPALRFSVSLKPGECVAFDNRRVLHARTAFKLAKQRDHEKEENIRWLVGCYLDETSVRDRFRVLSAETGWVPER